MRVVRLPVAELPAMGGEVVLDRAATHHAAVLRLCPGARVVLFDGRGGEADATVGTAAAHGLVCVAQPRRHVDVDRPRVVLCPGLPKGSKLDAVVRAATELGVSEVRPFIAERSVSRPDAKRAAKRTERLGAVAREAARQSGRAEVPAVHPPGSLPDVLGGAGTARCIAFHPHGGARLRDALEGAGDVWLWVGPEGGLSEGELAHITGAGGRLVSLGSTVLRTETAGPVVVALTLHALGALG